MKGVVPMKKRNKMTFTAILLCLILLFSFVGCNKNTPDPKIKEKTVTLDYTVKTDIRYSDDMSPQPFENGYAKIYYFGTVDKDYESDFAGNHFNYIDAKENLVLDSHYHEISDFTKDGVAVAEERYFLNPELEDDLQINHYLINAKENFTKTEIDQNTYKTKFTEFALDDEDPIPPGGDKEVKILPIEVDDKTHYRYCVLDQNDEVLQILAQKDMNGSIRFLTDDLIVCGFGNGNFGWGDYFQLFHINGTQVRDENFDQIGDFDNQYAPFVLNGKLGLLNTSGEIVVEPCIAVNSMRSLNLKENKIIINDTRHIGIVEVKECDTMQLSFVSKDTVDPDFLFPYSYEHTLFYSNEERGFVYINEQGNRVPGVYKMAYPFDERGIAVVQTSDDEWIQIATDGHKITDANPPAYTPITEIYDQDHLFGVKRDGKKLTEPIFAWIESVSSNMNFAKLSQGEHKNVMIDLEGSILATLPDDCIGAKQQGENLILKTPKGYQLADLKGTILNQTYFTGIGNFENGLAAFTLDGKVGLIAKDGTIKIEPTLTMDPITPAYGLGKIVGAVHGKLAVITVIQ